MSEQAIGTPVALFDGGKSQYRDGLGTSGQETWEFHGCGVVGDVIVKLEDGEGGRVGVGEATDGGGQKALGLIVFAAEVFKYKRGEIGPGAHGIGKVVGWERNVNVCEDDDLEVGALAKSKRELDG